MVLLYLLLLLRSGPLYSSWAAWLLSYYFCTEKALHSWHQYLLSIPQDFITLQQAVLVILWNVFVILLAKT